MEISRDLLRTLRTEIDAALAEVGAKHGLTLHADGARFDSLEATFKLTVKQATVAGVEAIVDNEREQFMRYAVVLGCKQEWFGKTFVMRGSGYTVAGIAPGRDKNCVKIRRHDGKGFVCPPSTVAIHMRDAA